MSLVVCRLEKEGFVVVGVHSLWTPTVERSIAHRESFHFSASADHKEGKIKSGDENR